MGWRAAHNRQTPAGVRLSAVEDGAREAATMGLIFSRSRAPRGVDDGDKSELGRRQYNGGEVLIEVLADFRRYRLQETVQQVREHYTHSGPPLSMNSTTPSALSTLPASAESLVMRT